MRLASVSTFLAAALLFGLLTPLAGAEALPIAPIREVVDTYFDQNVKDPYRWLEDLKNPETQQWMRAQSENAQRTLQALPERAAILKRLKELDAATPAHVELGCVRETAGGEVFFLRRSAGEDAAQLYVRRGWSGEERLLFDPGTLNAQGGKSHSIDYVYPSLEGRHVAIGTSGGGSEQSALWVLDTKTGKIADGPIDRSYFSFANVSWLPGGQSMLIRRFPPLAKDAPAAHKMLHQQVWLHRLGTPVERDTLVFGHQYPQLDFAPQDFPGIHLAATSPYAIAVKAGARSEVGLFAMLRKDLGKAGALWRKLFDYDDQVIDAALHGDTLYVLSNRGAPRGRILKIDLARRTPPREFLPEGDLTIDLLGGASDALYFRQRDGVYERLMRVGYQGGAPQRIEFDARGSISPSAACGTSSPFTLLATPDVEGVRVRVGTWTRPYALYRVKAGEPRAEDTHLQPSLKDVDLTRYTVDDLQARSHDGVQIPLSVVRPKEFSRDGSHVVLLQGYGAYGISLSPRFYESSLAWLERGVVRATCHVRGGGEYGEAWHRAGWQATKSNTWRDFIACAETLIREQYTTADKLIGTGASAGGILIGNAMTERPELFKAVIINVGVLDTLRFVTASANGPNHHAEFGNPATREGFEALRTASAYLKVKDGLNYPATLLMQGVNDTRVDVWESTKMAARLQAANRGNKPVLLRLEYGGGHHGAGANDALRAMADSLAFALWQTQSPKPAQ